MTIEQRQDVSWGSELFAGGILMILSGLQVAARSKAPPVFCWHLQICVRMAVSINDVPHFLFTRNTHFGGFEILSDVLGAPFV